MDAITFFQSLNIDTKSYNSGTHYVQCPKCHDERKKKGTKELLVNFDIGYTECFHCGFNAHIYSLKNDDNTPVKFEPPPPIAQKFITPEPIFNWVIPDAIIEPTPQKPMIGTYTITWYYRNINDKLTGAKKMEYQFSETGFHRTDSMPLHLYKRDSGYIPCLFYERDLYIFPYAKVILVESEKTAGILRKKFKTNLKEFIFIATSGSNGLTSEKAKILAGRDVLICYDCDNGEPQPDGTIKGPKGREGAQSAHTKLAAICKSQVVDLDPTKHDGTDLADMIDLVDIDYLKALSGENKFNPGLIEKIKSRNKEGEYWTKKAADEIGVEFEIDHPKVYEMGRVYYEANKNEFGILKATLIKKVEYFLTGKFEFKKNTVSKRIFYRDKKIKTSSFIPCNYNDVWRLLQHNLPELNAKPKDLGISHVSNLLESDFVPEINPFEDYFHSLPQWDGVDHITKLGNYITTTDQQFWLTQFKKSLIRMIACTYGHIENRIIMVFVGPKQSQGKDSFIRFLCPSDLKEYYKEDPLVPGKDAEIALCQNFLWNLTELDQLTKREISEIKGIISRAQVKQRRSYGRQEENMSRIVNFWGSTNKDEFLTDTQNTRWLCFRVEEISHSYNDYIKNIREIDIRKVWAQAWYLFKSGESYLLNEAESNKRDIINHSFEYMPSEKQLIIKYLTPCSADHPGDNFVTNTEILQYLIAATDNKLHLVPENVGRSMTQLDFVPGTKRINNKPMRGYYALKQPLMNGTKQMATDNTPQPTMFDSIPGVSNGSDDETPF